MAYEHTNGKGVKYYLHKSEVTLRGGKPQTIYFFTKNETGGKGTPCDLPEDRVVCESQEKIILARILGAKYTTSRSGIFLRFIMLDA